MPRASVSFGHVVSNDIFKPENEWPWGRDILVPRAAILLASATDRELWQGKSQFCSPRFADFRSTAQPQGLENVEWSINVAGQRTIDIFHEALNFGLQLLGAGHLKQYEVLKVCSY